MVQEIVWTSRALADLRKIYYYILDDSVRYAQAQIENIQIAVARLSSFPSIGRSVPEFPHLLYRELIVDNYRVIYRPQEDKIVIMAVVHGRRLLNDPPK